MDFSWPSYYHLTIKNPLPSTIVAGFRVKVDLTLVNELGSFRGDDILAECPLALRVLAVPLEDSKNPAITNDIHCEIMTKNVRIKPVIEKNGQGTISVQIAPANTLRGEDKIPFLLQVSISPSSRIFPYVLPACSQPMLLVSPDSTAATEFYAQQLDREEAEDMEDEDEDDDDDEHEHEHVHGPNCSHGHGHNHHHHRHDDKDLEDEDDEDAEYYLDEDEDEDLYLDDEDEDEEHEDDDIPPIAFETDGDMYIFEDAVETLEARGGIYHAFAADQLEHCKPSPKLVALLGEHAKTQQDTSGIAVQGMQYRKTQAFVPPSVANRRQAAVGIVTPAASQSSAPLSFTTVKTGFQKEGKAEELLSLQKSSLQILDPLCGALQTTKHITATTVSSRAALKKVAYAYIRITQGSFIGARIWDGALYMMRTLHRIITQNQVWLDGLRVLELGSGTGVLGIWLYAMVLQRARAQIEYVSKCAGASTTEVERILAYIAGGKDASSNSQPMAVSARSYAIAKALLQYTKPPVMVLTDMSEVMPLLRKNASYNENAPLSHWARVTSNCIDTFPLNTEAVSIERNHKELNLYDNAVLRSPIGLHAVQLDWNRMLSPAVLKCCGVTLSSTKDTTTTPSTVDPVFLKEIQRVLGVFPTLSNGSNIIKHYLYNNNMNHKHAFEIIAPHTTDIILASECLYNDRYFKALMETICRLFDAHRYAHAQRVHYYNAALSEYKQYLQSNGLSLKPELVPPMPSLELPAVLLSYRLRATHEDELIRDTFFRPLEAHGLYHTSINLLRLLPGAPLNQHTDQSYHVTAAVLQRAKEREEREKGVRNAMSELDLDRRDLTRLAVLYHCETNADGQLVAPINNMTPNAAFMYKLFQAL